MAYKRKEAENIEGLLTNGKKKFVKYEEGAAMFSMGIHSFMDLAKEAKAVYRIRRIVLVNTETIEEYLENFRGIEISRGMAPRERRVGLACKIAKLKVKICKRPFCINPAK